MSPELAFLLTLGLRMAITAAFVVTASVVTERSGPVIGALIATLPISAGPSYVFLALDHDAAFIAEGALASLPINAATIFLGLIYVVLAQRHGALLSCLTRGGGMDHARCDHPLGAMVAGRRADRQCHRLRHLRPAARPLPPRQDAADPAALVRHSAAGVAGRDAGGNCGYHLELGRPQGERHDRAVPDRVHQSMMLILHPRIGGPPTAAVLANSAWGLIGLGIAIAVLHVAALQFGSAIGLSLALATCIGWNFGLWWIGRRKMAA